MMGTGVFAAPALLARSLVERGVELLLEAGIADLAAFCIRNNALLIDNIDGWVCLDFIIGARLEAGVKERGIVQVKVAGEPLNIAHRDGGGIGSSRILVVAAIGRGTDAQHLHAFARVVLLTLLERAGL